MTEHMGFGESIVFSLVGIALVFAVLVVLSLFIRALSAIIRAAERPRKAPAPATAAPAIPADDSVQNVQPLDDDLVPGAAGDILLHNVDDPTAAMVMAIVADELRLPLNELVFRSIRELSEDEADHEIASHEHHSL